jgi:hypothetical protein
MAHRASVSLVNAFGTAAAEKGDWSHFAQTHICGLASGLRSPREGVPPSVHLLEQQAAACARLHIHFLNLFIYILIVHGDFIVIFPYTCI